MSCKAAILVLFNFTSGRQGEEVGIARNLRCFLINILVNVTPTSDCRATENSSADPYSPPAAPLLEPATPTNPEPTTPQPLPPTPLFEPPAPPIPEVPETPTIASKSKSIGTERLLSRQQAVRDKQDRGRKFTSREVVRRLNMQRDELTKLTRNVHHGSKNDFIASLAQSVTSETEDHGDNWDGSLSPQDVINLAKRAHDPKTKKTVYDTIIDQDAANNHHLSAVEVLDPQDTTNPTEMMRSLRRKLPGFFDSERKVNTLKSKFRREFEVV